jgi:hypothetical protein
VVESGLEQPSTAPAGEAAVGPESESAGTSGSTGPVADALQALETLPDLDLAEHPDCYQRIHSELQSALATIDQA